MNITARHEFEVIPAFTHIAGSTYGTWTERETAVGLLKTIDSITSYDVTKKLWIDLAETTDDDSEGIISIQYDAMDLFNDHANLPPHCSLCIEDGEYRIIPYVEQGYHPMVSELPDNRDIDNETDEDALLVVNDHGNVECYLWDENKREYISQWGMV